MQEELMPSEYSSAIQPISENLVLYRLEKVLGRSPTKEDRECLSGCKCVEDFLKLITETYIGDVFVKGSGAGLGRLGEFYVSLRCEKAIAWEPRKGYDLWGAWRYDDLVRAGKVEVKTCGMLSPAATSWYPRISGYSDELIADVTVFICMVMNLNPCKAKLFVVPKSALQETFDDQKQRKPKGRPRISISGHEFNFNTGKRNAWYEYFLPDHTLLKETIGKYIHGKFAVMTVMQLSLF